MKQKIVITCLFIAFDLVTGLVKAFSTGTYDSSKMRAGLFHKLGEILAFLLFFCIDRYAPLIDISLPFQLTTAVTCYIVIMEIGSSIENIGAVNPDMGKYLSNMFEKLKSTETGAVKNGEDKTGEE